MAHRPNPASVKCDTCGESRFLKYSQLAGAMCRTCASDLGSKAAALVNTRPIEQRFWSRVDAAGDCWIWTGTKQKNGYGSFTVDGKTYRWDRYVFHLLGVQIPPGLQIDHLCRNRSCVNPDHLDIVTLSENLRRSQSPSAVNARKTHCPRRHELSGPNLYVETTKAGRSKRHCRACRQEAQARHQAKESGRREGGGG